jgi:CheY-like chemotaxis protein
MDYGQRILLVEDSRDDVELVTAALDTFHLTDRIDVVRDGAAALDYLECRGTYQQRSSGAPAFVLLDLKLPKISGLEVLQRLRANPGLRTVPVVVLTSSREEPDLLRAYDLGTNAYVVKPVRFDDFARAVREIGTFWATLNVTPTPRRS